MHPPAFPPVLQRRKLRLGCMVHNQKWNTSLVLWLSSTTTPEPPPWGAGFRHLILATFLVLCFQNTNSEINKIPQETRNPKASSNDWPGLSVYTRVFTSQMHEGKKRWVQTTSVHIVQASKCSVCPSVCCVAPDPTVACSHRWMSHLRAPLCFLAASALHLRKP
jgi:hypothetical protein